MNDISAKMPILFLFFLRRLSPLFQKMLWQLICAEKLSEHRLLLTQYYLYLWSQISPSFLLRVNKSAQHVEASLVSFHQN